MDLKTKKDDAVALLSLTSANGRVVVDDAVLRILHFNVTSTDIVAALPLGRYFDDLVMIDDSTVPVRVQLMAGTITVIQGVTGA
jgi:CBS domain-containing protein